MKIERELVDFILSVARSAYPDEFAGILRVEKGVLTEVLMLPGSAFSEGAAHLRLDMLPIDRSAVGTVHSHPAPSNSPSDADLVLFRKYGRIHLIVSYPYREQDLAAYTKAGEPIELEIID